MFLKAIDDSIYYYDSNSFWNLRIKSRSTQKEMQ